ncbi:hypothetical protein GQX74_011300 [Glossina fuscipes]|nr:hypothetical protein GQX74_011300 [Glossina fuscipes]
MLMATIKHILHDTVRIVAGQKSMPTLLKARYIHNRVKREESGGGPRSVTSLETEFEDIFFLQKNMLSYFLHIMRQKSGGSSFVSVQLLQTLNILFENIRKETSLYYSLSNNHAVASLANLFINCNICRILLPATVAMIEVLLFVGDN